MSTPIRRALPLIALPLLCGSLGPAFANGDAGITLLAKGDVVAANTEGERDLKRRSPVFESDTLKTGDDSRAQFRMKDGATLSLQANTTLTLTEYRYREDGRADSAVMKMVTGGLRTITGAVGKGDPDAYRVETPLGTIGIRGTVFEAEMVGKELFVAFWQGYGKITTPTCEALLGDGQTHRFVRVLESTECVFVEDILEGEGPQDTSPGESPFATGYSSEVVTTREQVEPLNLSTFGPTSGDPDFSTNEFQTIPGSLSIEIVFPE